MDQELLNGKIPENDSEMEKPAAKGKKGKKEKEKLTGWRRVVKEVREWVVSLAVAVIAVLLIKEFIFMPIRVDGSSMYPTLKDGERLAVTVYDSKIYNGIEKGDVVICNYPGRTNKDPILNLITMDTNFVKRVVGVPGDTVKRVSGVTYVNGEALDPRNYNPYNTAQLVGKSEERNENGESLYILKIGGAERALTLQQTRSYKVDYEYVLGEEEYFMVGDNRYNSHDSRAWNGPEIELVLTNDVRGDVGPVSKDMVVGRAKCVFWPINQLRSVPADTEYIDPKDR